VAAALSLVPASQAITEPPAASTGGTCFGDSGSPKFVGDSMVIGGVTSFGLNGTCGGAGGVFRMDRANGQTFINSFIAGHP
jgi:secreted trypsin-like serine protease